MIPNIPSRAGIALVVLLVATLSGCGRNSVDSYIASSKAYIEKREYAPAIIELKNALQKEPNSGEARYLLGIALYESGDPGAAEIELRKALAVGFDRARVQPALIEVLAETAQFDKVLKEAMPEDATGAEVKAALHAFVGDAYLGTGKVLDAKAAYAKALAVDPRSQGGQLGVAKINALERNLPQAQAIVDKVLAAAPQSLDALQLKADLLLAESKTPEAEKYFAKVIEYRPSAIKPYVSLVSLLVREKKLAEAAEWVGRLKKAVPNSPVSSYLDGLIAYAGGDLLRARESVRNAMKNWSDYQPALLLAGTVEHDLGGFVQAEEYLLKALELAPAEVSPRILLVSTYLRSGQIDKAKSELPTLLKRAPDEPRVWILAGETALRSGDAKKSLEYFEKAISLDPSNPAPRTRIGQVRLSTGDTERALQDLRSSAAADPSHFDADVSLINYHLGKREIGKAQAAVDVLQKKQLKNPLTHNLAGLVLLAKGDRAGARRAFERASELQPTFYPAAQNLATLDLQDKKPDDAEKRYKTILAIDPNHENAMMALIGLKQLAGADWSDIEKDVDRVISANPGSARVRLAKVEMLARQGNVKGALVAAQDARAALPDSAPVLNALAKLQSLAGEHVQAIDNFGKLSTMMPTSARPFIGQAEAYAAAKDWKSADSALRKALEREPNSIDALTALIRIGVVTGSFEQAKIDARTLQKRIPTNVIGYIAESDVLAAQKKTAEAEAFLRSTIKTKDAPALTLKLFALLNENNKKADANAVVNEWALRHPKDLAVAKYVGDYELSRKDYRAAASWYRMVMKAQPGNTAVLNNLAWALGQSGDPEALAVAEKALAAAPESAAVLDTVGALYAQNGRVDKGIELLAKATKIAPRSPTVRLNYAKALIVAGKRGDAKKQLEQVATLPAAPAIKEEAAKLLAAQ